MQPYQYLETKVLPFLKGYQTDITKHDYNVLIDYTGPFFYGYRETGTDLITVPTSLKDFFKATFIQQLPTNKYQAIERIKSSLNDHFLSIHYSNTQFLYYDGANFHSKTKQQMLLMWEAIVSNLISKLECINPENTLTNIF